MPTPTKGARLGSSPAHERIILANLATSLFENGKIKTTLIRAKRLRPHAEKLLTLAKKGDLHARRQVMTVIRSKSVVHHLFTEIAGQIEDREGGYLRITKLDSRKGDASPMALIEIITEPVVKNPSSKKAELKAAAEKAQVEADKAAVKAAKEAEKAAAEADEVVASDDATADEVAAAEDKASTAEALAEDVKEAAAEVDAEANA